MGTFGNPHVGDIGSKLKVTMKEDLDTGSFPVVDIANFDTRSIIIQDPDGNEVTKTASLFTDGSDGIIFYDTVDATILHKRGTWRRRGLISDTVSGNAFGGSWISFEVDP